MKRLILSLSLFLLGASCLGDDGYLPLTIPGTHIQRTMSLLAESTATKRNSVKVLFYGQNSLEDFVSNSKRVVIPGGSDNWGGIGFGLKYRSENGPRPLPEDFKITWKSYRLASDTVQFPDAEKVGIERRITLVQGITSSEHVLRLAPLPGKTLSIKCFRVFMPPL